MKNEERKRRMVFAVPADRMAEFAEVLEEYSLANSISGRDEDEEDCISVGVEYEEEEKEGIYKLLEITHSEFVDDPDEEADEDNR